MPTVRLYYENRALTLNAGERTRPIDQRDGELPVESVTLVIGPVPAGAGGSATIEIWGLQARLAALAAPSPPAAAPPSKPAPKLRPRGETDDDSAVQSLAQKRGYFEVPVFFGTTRMRSGEKLKNNRIVVKFGNDLRQLLALTLGRAVVTQLLDMIVPLARSSARRPISSSSASRSAPRIRPATSPSPRRRCCTRDFVSEMKQQIAGARKFKDQALVFVHGYNVSFDDAIFRTAQIAKDIDFDGPAVTFSW